MNKNVLLRSFSFIAIDKSRAKVVRYRKGKNAFPKYRVRAIDTRNVHFSFDAASHEEFMPHGGIPIRSRISLNIVGSSR